jgi:hypothetical protein
VNRKKVVIATAVTVIVAAIGMFSLLATRERPYDRAFDSQVRDPAYRTSGPIVLFDESHLNTHTTTGGYRPLAELLRNDGYRLRVSRQRLSLPELEGVSILVLALARGANDANDDPAYSEAEEVVIEGWVRSGGSLLLITDHWPYGSAVSSLAGRFEVEMGAGMAEDVTHHDPDRGTSHLIFSVDNRLLRDHPIVRGRSSAERVRRVLSFTGQSLQGAAAAVPFLALSDVATERPPGPPRVERAGGDVRVHMEYGDPVAAAGRAQGLALEVDEGRVVVLGEAGMLRAQRPRNGLPVGMNVPGYDNRQLALNIMHWLSRLL